MAHSLTVTPPTAIPVSSSKSEKTTTIHAPSLGFQRAWACHKDPKQALDSNFIYRRTVTLGLASVLLGLTIGDQRANAARRPPPPPAMEKKDPNVSGVQAKVLASKKRKEAMKESMAKLREKGKKIIDEPSKPVTDEPSE